MFKSLRPNLLIARFLILLLIIFFSQSCRRSILTVYSQVSINKDDKVRTRTYNPNCRNPLNYLPDTIHKEVNIMKRVRINWHSVDDTTGLNNFKEDKLSYFYLLTENANYRLERNFKMTLPIGNKTPVYDPYFRWVISPSKGYEHKNGMYYHIDKNLTYFSNKGYNRTDYDDRVIKKLGIGLDSICNIFVIPFHPDTLKRSKVKINESGIALGNHVKLGGLMQSNKPEWEFATLLSHEIGHVFGLSHAWHEDGCDDTPNHQNCWNYTDTPPCDKEVSNNLMDYNSQMMAITPCQIGKIHMAINDTSSSKRNLVIPDWCKLSSDIIYVRDTMRWLGWRDVDKSIVIEDGGVLELCCRLGMPEGSSITVKIGGTLILHDVTLHNDCDKMWNGIIVEKKGNKHGKVRESGIVKILDVNFEKAKLLIQK